jgi:phosphate transport system permease protein
MNHRFTDRAIIGFSYMSGMLLITILASLIGYLCFRGVSTLQPSLIFGKVHPIDAILLGKPVLKGLFPAIIGTLSLVMFSITLAIPVGVAAGIFLVEYAQGTFKYTVDLILDILAGIPSIVIGLFGFSVAVFLHHHFSDRIFPCLLISALSLAFLTIPYLVRSTETALNDIPESLRITAFVLGASKLQNIRWVLLPHSISGIIRGVVLSIGRCAEDTAVIMLTGVVASAGIPKSIFSGYEALPFYIYYISSQYTSQAELKTGFGAAILLLCLCGFFFMLAAVMQKKLTGRFHHRV